MGTNVTDSYSIDYFDFSMNVVVEFIPLITDPQGVFVAWVFPPVRAVVLNYSLEIQQAYVVACLAKRDVLF